GVASEPEVCVMGGSWYADLESPKKEGPRKGIIRRALEGSGTARWILESLLLQRSLFRRPCPGHRCPTASPECRGIHREILLISQTRCQHFSRRATESVVPRNSRAITAWNL